MQLNSFVDMLNKKIKNKLIITDFVHSTPLRHVVVSLANLHTIQFQQRLRPSPHGTPQSICYIQFGCILQGLP